MHWIISIWIYLPHCLQWMTEQTVMQNVNVIIVIVFILPSFRGIRGSLATYDLPLSIHNNEEYDVKGTT